MAKFVLLPDEELRRLNRLAQVNIVYLLVVSLASFFGGACALTAPDLYPALPLCLRPIVAQALIGFSGSAVAALTSCLDRYATGFERENGAPFPKNAKPGSDKFNRRFARWLFVRPFLGAIVAPTFIWGLSHFTNEPERYRAAIGFTAFIAGLLAKSVLELMKNLFKNVFKS